MTDGERARALLGYGMTFQAGEISAEQAYDYVMRDIAAIREDERNKVLQSLQSEKEADHD